MVLKSSRYLTFAAAALGAAALFWFLSGGLHTLGVTFSNTLPHKTIHVGSATVVVEVASHAVDRERGLSGRTALPQGRGMLFDMGGEGEWGFWMKDMHFAIDILWLSHEGRVVHIEHDVAPDTYPNVFRSTLPAYWVLELPAGYSAASGISVGDTIQL